MDWDLLPHRGQDLITLEVHAMSCLHSALGQQCHTLLTQQSLLQASELQDIRYIFVAHMYVQRVVHASGNHASVWMQEARHSLRLQKQQCLVSRSVVSWHVGVSDDERGHFRGSDVGRSDSGEVEMTEFDRPGMPRNTSASMLDEPAGTRAGMYSSH